MEGRRPRRPVPGALLAADRPPGKCGSGEPEHLRPITRQVDGRVTPSKRIPSGHRKVVRQERQDERLRIPEGVAVVSRSGQALCRNRPLLGSRPGLEDVEEGEANRLLELWIAVDLDVGAVPEVIEKLALARDQAVPALVAGPGECPPPPVGSQPGASAGSTTRRTGT